MSKNRVVNLIYRNKPLRLDLFCRCAHGPLRRASPGIQPPATPSLPPPLAGRLHPLYFYVLWCRANFSQFLKSTLLYCEMGLRRSHEGVFWLMKCYATLQPFFFLGFTVWQQILIFRMSINKILWNAAFQQAND